MTGGLVVRDLVLRALVVRWILGPIVHVEGRSTGSAGMNHH
jgi:hypothetical protein